MKILFLVSFSLLLGFVGQDGFAETEMTGWLRILDSHNSDPGQHSYLYYFQPADQITFHKLNPDILPSNIIDWAGEKVRVTVDENGSAPLAMSLSPNEPFLDIFAIELVNQPLDISFSDITGHTRSVTLLSKFMDVPGTPSEDQFTSPGQLHFPYGVTVDSSGNIYVIELGESLTITGNRVQKFDSSGNLLLKFGRLGTNDGEFLFPTGIAVDNAGNIYVVDNNAHRIQKFDSNGMFLLAFGSNGSGDGEFFFPWGIAVDNSDNVYVADLINHRIQKFDSSGIFQGWLGKCTGGANCDAGNQRSNGFMCSAATCTGLGFGGGDGQFNAPRAIAFDPSDNFYVVQSANDRIQKFDSNGGFLIGTFAFGGDGSAEGQFINPHGIAVDMNNVYVSDAGNHRVQKFDTSLAFVSMWGWGVQDGTAELQTCTSGCQIGLAGSGVGQLDSPEGIASGSIYVADANNDRVKKFDVDGVFQSELGEVPDLIHDSAYYDGIFYTNTGSLKNYYDTSSYGKFNWDGSVDDWLTLPETQATYSDDLIPMLVDAVNLHDDNVNYCGADPVTNLQLVFNGDLNPQGSAVGTLGGGVDIIIPADGCTISVSVSWYPDNGGGFATGLAYDRGIGVPAHELGHNLEFEHTPPPPGLWEQGSSPYHDSNSVMSTNADFEGPSALIMPQRDKAGWVASPSKVTIADGMSATITLDFSNEPEGGENPQMITVPFSDGSGNSWIIEGHKDGLFNDTPQDRKGAIIYKHFPGGNQYPYLSMGDKSAPYSLVATAGTDETDDFDLAMLELGESYEEVANSITVTVQSITATSVTVFVSNNASPDTDNDGVPDDSDNCINVPNPNQYNLDNDDFGNLCDPLTNVTISQMINDCMEFGGDVSVTGGALLTFTAIGKAILPLGSFFSVSSTSGALLTAGSSLNLSDTLEC